MDTREARTAIFLEAARDAGKEAMRGTAVYAAVNMAQISKTVAAAVISGAFRIAEEARKYRNSDITGTECAEAVADVCLSALTGVICAELAQKRIKNPTIAPILGSAAGVFLYQLAKVPVKLAVDALPGANPTRA